MFNDRESNNKSTKSTIYKEYDRAENQNGVDNFENYFYYNNERDSFKQPENDYGFQQSTATENEFDESVTYYNEEDITPSEKTMNLRRNYTDRKADSALFDSARFEEDKEENTSFKLTTRGKTLIAVYAIAVVVLFAVIILNTTVLRSMNNRVESLQEEIQIMQNENQQLAEKLEFVQSEEEVIRKAQEMGMIK